MTPPQVDRRTELLALTCHLADGNAADPRLPGLLAAAAVTGPARDLVTYVAVMRDRVAPLRRHVEAVAGQNVLFVLRAMDHPDGGQLLEPAAEVTDRAAQLAAWAALLSMQEPRPDAFTLWAGLAATWARDTPGGSLPRLCLTTAAWTRDLIGPALLRHLVESVAEADGRNAGLVRQWADYLDADPDYLRRNPTFGFIASGHWTEVDG